MSDEETDNEGTGFTVHKLGWRSNLLNRLLSRLDKRYDENRKNSTLRTKPREKRTLGEYSTRCKPFGASKWTFQEQSSLTETESPVSVQQSPPTESPITPQRLSSRRALRTFQDSARSNIDTPTADPMCSSQTTPSGSLSNALDPTQLFEESDVDNIVSDDELETLIRAATMRL